MLNRRIAGIVVAGLLSVAGAANAAESGFPSSAVEHPTGPTGYVAIERGATAVVSGGATQSTFPSSGDEFAAILVPAVEPTRLMDRPERTYRSEFPSSVSEIGPTL